MGVDHIVVGFIGRKCTAEESADFLARLKDMNPDDLDSERLTDIEVAHPDTSYFRVGDFPVIMYNYGSDLYPLEEILTWPDQNLEDWYVVEEFLFRQSHRDDRTTHDFTTWPRPRDPSHQLVILHQVF